MYDCNIGGGTSIKVDCGKQGFPSIVLDWIHILKENQTILFPNVFSHVKIIIAKKLLTDSNKVYFFDLLQV